MSVTNNETNEPQSHVEPDDIGVGMLTVLGAMVAVVIVLIVVLLQAWFYNWKDAMIARRAGPIDEQTAPARIERYGWADPKKRLRAIPITRAMQLIVDENAAESATTGTGKESGRK